MSHLQPHKNETPQIDSNHKEGSMSNELEDIFAQLQKQNNILKAQRNKNAVFSNKDQEQKGVQREAPLEGNESMASALFSINQGAHAQPNQGSEFNLMKPMMSTEPDRDKTKDKDKDKAKIIDDLFCSTNVNQKQSVNVIGLLYKKSKADEKRQPLSLSKQLDEFFPIENSNKADNAELKDKYISPNMMIIEEEDQKIVNNGLSDSYGLHRVETIKEQQIELGLQPPLLIDFTQSRHGIDPNSNKTVSQKNIFPSSFDFVSANSPHARPSEKKKELKAYSNEASMPLTTKSETEKIRDSKSLEKSNAQREKELNQSNRQCFDRSDEILNEEKKKRSINDKSKELHSFKQPSIIQSSNEQKEDSSTITFTRDNQLHHKGIMQSIHSHNPKHKSIEESTFLLLKSRISEKRKIEPVKKINADLSEEKPYQKSNFSIIPSKDLIRRRNALLEGNYFFSVMLHKEKAPPNHHGISSEYHLKVKDNFEAIKEKYNLLYIHSGIDERNALYEKLINASVNMDYTSCLHNQKSFKAMFNYPHNPSTIFFEYYRLFQINGNSFYFSFMFAYIEQMLIYQKQSELFALFVDILRLSDCYEDAYKSINMKEAYAFFGLISDLVQSVQYILAYQLFIISFMDQKKDGVASLLVLYMKWCLFAMQYDDVYDASLEQTQGGPKVNYLKDDYQIDNIMKAEMEPGKLVLESVPFLFNVKLKVYWIEGDTNKAKLEISEFSNYNKDPITIHLGYFYSGYACVYLKGVYDYNQIFKDVNQAFVTEAPSISLSDKRRCLECNFNTQEVNFYHFGKGMCFDCLESAVKAVTNKRAKCYISEGFQNIEYYCDTMLFNDKSIAIRSCDAITIFNKTIQEMMVNAINKMCYSCGRQCDKDDLLKFACLCVICTDCLLKKLKQATSGKMILHSYEMRTIKGSYCFCRGLFNIEEAVRLSQLPLKDERAQAKNRWLELVSTSCMICVSHLREVRDVDQQAHPPSKREFILLKIARPMGNIELMPGVDFIDSDHLICVKCIKKLGLDTSYNSHSSYKRKNDQQKDRGVLEDQLLQHCTICNIEHLIDKKDLYIKRTTVCCSQPCLIV